MNYAVYNIALDIHKTGSQVALSMIRGENKRKIVISLMENGRPYKIADGCTAMFSAIKPDEKAIYNDCEIDYENNLIIYNVTSQTTAAMGEVKCQIELIGSDGGLLFSPTFSLVVANKLYNQEPILASSEEFNALSIYIADLQKKVTDGVFKGEKGDKGDRGPQGIQGETGPAGKDADVSELSPAVVCTSTGTAIAISDSSESGFEAFSIYGKSTQNGTPTPNAPVDIVSVGVDGGIDLTVNGINLFDLEGGYINGKPSPITFIENGFVLNASVSATRIYRFPCKLKKGNTYFLSFDVDKVSGTGDVQAYLPKLEQYITLGKTFSPNVDTDELGLFFSEKDVPTVINVRNVQVSLTTTKKDYEPFKSQSITMPTSNALRAIPVTDSSLATYTDANGQMWYADEIDLERGVFIQRCFFETVGMTLQAENNRYVGTTSKKANSKIGTSNGIAVICKELSYHGDAGLVGTQTNGVRISAYDGITMVAYYNGQAINLLDVLYPLETPIETPLTSEQIAQYKALKTNYPSTTILNDENAFMKVGYRADTKKFVERMSGSTTQISSVTLAASKWVGTASPYSQVVTIPGTTKNSKININPTVEQLNIFHNKDLAFVVGNNNGVITVYCIGQKPANDYTMQVSITEVNKI